MNLSTEELQNLSEVAESAAVAAGKYIQSQFNVYHQRKIKAGGDSIASRVVTEVDLKAQEIILNHLKHVDRYDFGMLSEESKDDRSRTTKDYFWCIDPLDGTLPFIEGESGYAVSIALVSKAGDPFIGIVYLPDSELCYSSVKGKGVRLNNERFSYPLNGSSDSLDVFTDRSFIKSPTYSDAINSIEQWTQSRKIRKLNIHQGFGAVCNAIGVMKSGNGCYFKFPKPEEGGGSIWDFAATALFFEELGLFVSDINGNKLHLNNPKTTFMNELGIVYSNNQFLSDYIRFLAKDLNL